MKRRTPVPPVPPPLLLPAVTALACARYALFAAHADEAATFSQEWRDSLRGGNVREIRSALDRGAAVGARDAQGNTPLHLAALHADASVVTVDLAGELGQCTARISDDGIGFSAPAGRSDSAGRGLPAVRDRVA